VDLENMTNQLYRLMSPGGSWEVALCGGVNGVAAIAHGSSRAPQIVGTIKQAKLAVESRFVDTLRDELEKVQKTISA